MDINGMTSFDQRYQASAKLFSSQLEHFTILF
jgi:hypothetical protein